MDIESSNEVPVISYLNQLFSWVAERNGSDIHFEPRADHLDIRYRSAGMLASYPKPPAPLFQRAIPIRLKLLAQLDIAKTHLPQDGRFTLSTPYKLLHCRLSTCPSVFGEKLACRLLTDYSERRQVEDLGLLPEELDQVKRSASLLKGLILFCGPTGSGKTTSLYALLDWLAKPTYHCITIEDPVEIIFPTITQIQIQPERGLGFPQILRHILRQDPDILMIGELRDRESAAIALQAAITGHLVLTSLHAGSASEALLRLKHLGLSSVDIQQSVSLIVTQQLVPTLCTHCEGKSCSTCQNGYQRQQASFHLWLP